MTGKGVSSEKLWTRTRTHTINHPFLDLRYIDLEGLSDLGIGEILPNIFESKCCERK